ncbi:class I SAM-dependent methyltransferase [Tunicatimonas pelagia]|uniref:class I SAM-dependent methyltransferase n=1 Tax=Tunicatimonas pelagia TaxID=931531 RepID=UPI002665B022|nr:class I SAM-dependent methyltransferase [Tunicatimonas pelagia]WKN41206.1 methyltransferase domain-containing protein [Tunicatimonas pelagia]
MKWLIQWAIRYVPRKYLQLISQPLLRLIAFFYQGDRLFCPVDERGYRKFLPYGRIETRQNALCPGSLTLERHRLLWLYLQDKTDFFAKPQKLLHVAPEICFIPKFSEMPTLDYTTGDLDSPWADIKMDLHDIPFGDNTFDIVLCNHVMEHVKDDIRCASEICRVLKPNGWAIIQSPTYNIPVTQEDTSVTDPKERERLYGQDDHVRRYGHDYGDRLRQGGFQVTEDDYVKHFTPEQIQRYALMKNEIVYFCKKPSARDRNADSKTLKSTK